MYERVPLENKEKKENRVKAIELSCMCGKPTADEKNQPQIPRGNKNLQKATMHICDARKKISQERMRR